MSSEQRRLADRYVLGTRIGAGGMGEVFRATDTVLDREVAVKTIDLSRVSDESAAARFEREARVTAGMSDPGVVTVHDSGVEGDTAYLVMELLPGPTLAERISEGPLPVEEVVEVGQQVSSALAAAHARGLVHRDIKPANIAYAADGRVRVLDFGITQLADSTDVPSLTATHTVMGTAEYLAPEQAMGGRVDGRADLYALGCVLYALLVGGPPFRGPSAVATMMMHANDPVPDVRDARPETPYWLGDLVSSLLAKDPEDRPAGAAAVAAALAARTAPAAGATTVLPTTGTTQPLEAAATRVSTPPPPPPPPTEARGRSSSWIVGVVVVVVLVALLGWWLSTLDPSGTPDETPSPSVSTSTTSTPTPSSTPSESTPSAEPTTASPTPTPTPTESETESSSPPTTSSPSIPPSPAPSASPT